MVKGKIIIIICKYGFAPKKYVFSMTNYICTENINTILDSNLSTNLSNLNTYLFDSKQYKLL